MIGIRQSFCAPLPGDLKEEDPRLDVRPFSTWSKEVDPRKGFHPWIHSNTYPVLPASTDVGVFLLGPPSSTAKWPRNLRAEGMSKHGSLNEMDDETDFDGAITEFRRRCLHIHQR
ncbi:hypothetical protein Mapa_004932 [Marchantia paleacea]|nr:hypothetical protein Mapa_004932 [Marchantia paleacea]